jgi:hypothetical protein
MFMRDLRWDPCVRTPQKFSVCLRLFVGTNWSLTRLFFATAHSRSASV